MIVVIKDAVRVLAVIVISLTGVLACGGGGDTNTSPSTSPSLPGTPSAPAAPFIPPPVPAPETGEGNLEALVSGQPFFSSPHFNPITASDQYVYVVNTPSDTVDVISIQSASIITRIPVGLDPVSLAIRPDGNEIWVSNHVSDSITVIDTDDESQTFHQVIASIQEFNPTSRSTLFDEPVGIAFANNEKAYVALSSLDRIAVIDVTSRRLTKTITINAQDPRAIAVQGNRLYVLPFESNNQTELSGCFGNIDGNQCTFSLQQHVVDNNNVLSRFYDADIVKDPNVPDRDLFVFDTENERQISVISGVGTLLYGLTVDSKGKVYVSQTDARNHINGRAGTQKHTLKELENRAFLNQIGRIDCSSASCGVASAFELEPLPPENPLKEHTLATPFGLKISQDDKTLIGTAAGSDRLFTMDAVTGERIGQVNVGAVPRGVALLSSPDGKPESGWVLNTVDNSVSIVDLSRLDAPIVTGVVPLPDPTPAEIKLGRAMFNNANASSTGTFSCESCHPDGHTDQLLWVLGGPKCDLPGCTQIPVRATMPIRGARDTAPYHWDGVPGDPFGGRNGQSPNGNVPANCTDAESCVRHVIDGSLSSTMCTTEDCPINEEGKAGLLNAEERDALARFLLAVPYPPARARPFDDLITSQARKGFDDFFVQDASNSVAGQTCGSSGCHDMPFWTSTNIPGSGMDAPTFRGLPDRWLVLPQGRVNMVELYGTNGNKGFDERDMWLRIISGSTASQWQMFLEGSTGYSGALGRQITLNQDFEQLPQIVRQDLFNALEDAAIQGAIILEGHGVKVSGQNTPTTPISLTFSQGNYWNSLATERFSREQLIQLANNGELVLTLVARSGQNSDYSHPQPAIWSTQSKIGNNKINFPVMGVNQPIRLIGRHISDTARVFVDGRKVQGNVICEKGEFPTCLNEVVLVNLDQLPPSKGMHLLQVQTKNGLFSNEYLFFTN